MKISADSFLTTNLVVDFDLSCDLHSVSSIGSDSESLYFITDRFSVLASLDSESVNDYDDDGRTGRMERHTEWVEC